MTEPLDKTLDACMQWLGPQAKTVRDDPKQTLKIPEARTESWARAETMLAAALSGEGPRLVIGEELGQGGEGIVRLAEQRSLGRKVAVKTLRADRRSHQARVGLLREAWLLGRLEHPNILPVHDLAADGEGEPQVVLKRIEGTSWGEVIASAAATEELFGEELFDHNIEVLQQLCQAVRFAHSRGVVHRDLKPDNVMIGAFGEVYLLDWGIAVVVDEEEMVPRVVAGTPAYMAPEMLGVANMPITPKTDVYLLGAILYEIVCGRPPHLGEETRDVMESILSSPPDMPAGVPADLADLVRRSMSPEPAERPSVDAFRVALLDHRRIRTSSTLASQAERSLEELTAMVDAEEIRLERAYDRHGACRFGFTQALEAWPNNPRARRGLHDAGCAMVRLELARGDAEAAGAQLDRIEAPPADLVAEVGRARARQSSERARLDALEQLGDQHDRSTGRDVRLWLAVAIGIMWITAPFFAIWGELEGHRQPYPGIIAPVVYLVMIALGLSQYREILLRTTLNRRTVAVITVAMVATATMSLGAWAMGVTHFQARVLQLIVAGHAAAAAALSIDRRFWWAATGYLVGFALSATVFDDMTAPLLAHSACHTVTTIVIYVIWRRPPKDLGERYGVR